MRLALTALFRAKWSADVHEEWIIGVLRNRPDLSRQKLERTRYLMDLHATDALVSGYESLIPGLELPDPDDRHVLAAAIRGRANVIVTANLRDFPQQVIAAFDIEAQHPDDFVMNLLHLAPSVVAPAAHEHRESLRSPAKSIQQYLETLVTQGLPQTASALRELMS
jgi:predicted nucleic acid-binding protein